MNYDNLILSMKPLTSRVRTDVTAIKKDGKMMWSKQSLTTKRLEMHIAGAAGRGVCPIRAGDDRTAVAVLDFDSHKGETPFSDMVAAARIVSDALQASGVTTHPFTSSGGRGIHLIAVWDETQDAYSVRRFLADRLASVGYKSGTGGVAKQEVEIFPKQDNVPRDGYGNQFILPYHNASEPLDLDLGITTGKEPIEWKMSKPVTTLEKPVRELKKTVPTGDLKKWADMVVAIDSDCSYEEWLRVGMALHFESDGDPEGLAIWDEWSSTGSKYPGPEILERKWQTFGGKNNQVTGGSIEAIARTAGYVADIFDDFEDVATLAADAPQVDERGFMRFVRNDDGGIKAIPENVTLAVSRDDFCGWLIRYDTFRDEIMLRDVDDKWRQFADADYMELRVRLGKKGFSPVGRDMIRDAVAWVADRNRFDTALHWLNGLPKWDGVKRIDRFMPDYFGAKDDAYTQAVGAYIWTALAGRVLQPGCKADMCPILVGRQGIRKSSAVATMVPVQELFCEVSFAEKDDDLARKMRGRLIAEIGELRGLHTKELESIKAFIARTHENWIPKFKEFATTFPRRLIFIGTTNQAEFLADETGNRRWLPVDVVLADTDAIARDRLQLWAEGRARFLASGVAWRDAERLASEVHGRYTITDAWEDPIMDYMHRESMDGTLPKDQEFITSRELFSIALGLDPKNLGNREEWRLGKILRGWGYEKAQKWVENKNKKVWVKKPSPFFDVLAPSSLLEDRFDDLV